MANTPSKKVGPAKAAGTSKKVTASTDKPAPKKAPAKKAGITVTDAEVEAVLKEAPGIWAKIKGFFGIK